MNGRAEQICKRLPCLSCSRFLSFQPPSDKARILIFGAAAVDITSQTQSAGQAQLKATTYPGRVSVTLGGVARNIAEAATRVLSAAASSSSLSPVKLISPHGNDDFGLLLRTGMEQIGMRIDGLFIPASDVNESRTAVCSLMLEDGGDLISGVADMNIGRTALYPQVKSRNGTLQGMLEEEAPEVIVFDGNIGAQQAAELLTACEAFNADRKSKQVLTLFEPTSIAKSTIVLDHFAATRSKGHRSRPISFATPNAVELEQIHSEAARLGLVPVHPPSAPSANITLDVDRSTLNKALALVSHGIFATILLKVGRHGVVTIDADRIRHHPFQQVRYAWSTPPAAETASPAPLSPHSRISYRGSHQRATRLGTTSSTQRLRSGSSQHATR